MLPQIITARPREWLRIQFYQLIFLVSVFLVDWLISCTTEKDIDVMTWKYLSHSLQWRHNGCDSVSNHQPHICFLNRLFRHRSKKTSKLRVTGFCAGNSPEAGEFPAQMASNAENVSIWWRHHITGSLWLESPVTSRLGQLRLIWLLRINEIPWRSSFAEP